MSLFRSEITSLGLSAPELRSGNSLENPAISLSSPSAWAWIIDSDPTASGEIINDKTALQVVTVYACVRIIAETVASLPLLLYSVNDRGRMEASEHPLHDLFSIQPNPEQSAFTFWETFTGCLALTGNAFAQIERAKNGNVLGLWPLDPRKTAPYRTQSGNLIYRTSDGESEGKEREIAAADMIHCPLFSFDGLRGLSPIQQARQALGLSRAAEKFGARFFGNGSRPGGILSQKTPGPQSDKDSVNAKKTWESSLGGINQGRIAVLPGDWSYTSIGMSPEESQFLVTRQFQRAEIAALFRIDPHYVGDTTRMSNSNHEQQSLQFITDTIRPYLTRIENEISRKILIPAGMHKSFSIGFDVRERLRGDFATTMQGFATGRQWGWFNANDVLRELGENPGGPELDVYLVPVNMQNAERLLDTESIQDQPVAGTNQNDPAPVPTPAERNALKQYSQAYIRLFRDAVGRLCKRDKRDLIAVSQAFAPVIESLAELVADGHINADAVTTHLSAITNRAATWIAGDADAIAANELLLAVRAMESSKEERNV